jgi:glycosyltransferase involved in cell wall biosynthesis
MSKSIKVCFLIPSLSDVSPVNAAISMALGLKENFNVTLLSYDRISDLKKKSALNEKGLHVASLEAGGIRDIMKAKSALTDMTSDTGFDVIISMLFRCDMLLAMTDVKSKKISSLRNMFYDEYRISYGRILGCFLYKLHSTFLSRFDVVVCMSDDMYDFFSSTLRNSNVSIKKIYNFLDEDRVLKQISEVSGEDVFPGREYPTVISVSSLIPRKRVDIILEVCLELYGDGVYFYLDIVGSGSEFERLSLQAATSFNGKKLIQFHGYSDNPMKYLYNANIFVMASESEGVSRSLMEALYLNKMCVVSDIPGNREFSRKSRGVSLFNSRAMFKEQLVQSLNEGEASFLPLEYMRKCALNEYTCLINDICKS